MFVTRIALTVCLTLGVAGGTAMALSRTSTSQATAAPISSLPEGEGQSLTAEVCGQCHSVGMFANQRKSRDEWNATIGRMIEKGMEAEEDELYAISDYLTEKLGKSDQAASIPS